MHNLNASPFLIKEREGILQKPFGSSESFIAQFHIFKNFLDG